MRFRIPLCTEKKGETAVSTETKLMPEESGRSDSPDGPTHVRACGGQRRAALPRSRVGQVPLNNGIIIIIGNW